MTAKIELLAPTVWFKLQETSVVSYAPIADSGVGPYTGAPWHYFSRNDRLTAQEPALAPLSGPCVLARHIPQDNDNQTYLSTANSTYGMELLGGTTEESAAVVTLLYKAPSDFYFNYGPSYDTYSSTLAISYRWPITVLPEGDGPTEVNSVGAEPTVAMRFSLGVMGVIEEMPELALHTIYIGAFRLTDVRMDSYVTITPATVGEFLTVGLWVSCPVGGTLSDIFLSNDSTELGTAYYGVHLSVNTTTGVMSVRYGSGGGTGASSYRLYTTGDTGVRADGVTRFIVFQTRVVTLDIDLQPLIWVNGTQFVPAYASGNLPSVSWATSGTKGAMFGVGHSQVPTMVSCTVDDPFIHFGKLTPAEVLQLYQSGL